MFCTTCATENPATLLRCERCGTPLQTTQTAAMLMRSQARGGSAPVRWLMAIVPVLVLAVVAVIVIRDLRHEHSTRAAAYERAENALAGGDYAGAFDAFTAAGDYRDAEQRRDETLAVIAPYRDAYLEGVNALDVGDYDLSIARLSSVVAELPLYEDAGELLNQAKALRTDELTNDLATAEANRDWLQAEQSLGLLMADDPDNAELQQRYTELTRFHSPMVFTRGGGVFIISPDLLDEQLVTNDVDGIWPSWSPDRSRIAFFALIDDQTVNYGLYVVNVDGSDLRLLAADVHLAGWPIWSPDGTRIAFSSLAQFMLNDQAGITSLHVVEVETGTEISYTSERFMYATSPSWSPDSQRIAFVSKEFLLGGPAVGSRAEGSLQILDLTTGAITPVAEDALPFAQYVTWSPKNDTLLVLSSEIGSAWYQTLISTIDMVDLRTGEVLPITKRSEIVSYPIWSPDGSRYAFAEGNHTVQVRTTTGATSWITVPRDISPFLTWAPDGQSLIAPALVTGDASLLVPIGSGESPIDFPLVFDYSNQLAGPPQWAAATPLHLQDNAESPAS